MDNDPHRTLDQIAQEAAGWTSRRDRGFTAAEQDKFSEWLAADPRHGAELARFHGVWGRLDKLGQWRPQHGAGPNPDLLAPPLRRRLLRFKPAVLPLAAAAAILLAGLLWFSIPTREGQVPSHAEPAVALQRILPDGSRVELNHGATIVVDYAPGERRIVLERGEAYFSVRRDPKRPFVVRAHGVDVRAIGTAFNVALRGAVVEVLVTEGRVEVAAPARVAAATGESISESRAALPMLEVNQRAVVPLGAAGGEPQVATLTRAEVVRVLAWQHRMLDFTDTPLDEIVAEFNRLNLVQLAVDDPALAGTRISATIRSDNVDGFVRVLETGFGIKAVRQGDADIVLRMLP